MRSIEWKGKTPTPEDVKSGVRFHITGTLIIELNDILGCDINSNCPPEGCNDCIPKDYSDHIDNSWKIVGHNLKITRLK